MLKFLFGFCLMALLPGTGKAQGDADRLYALIKAQDIPAVSAMLTQARKDDLASPSEFPAQRALFKVFELTDPDIDRLTEKWLAQSPDDPNALIARSDYLATIGWNHRGEEAAYRVPAEEMQTMIRLHTQAFQMALRATELAPDMASASDTVLWLAFGLHQQDKGFAEFQRFMNLHPNRRTLMKQMFGLSPQWGGDISYVKALCATYASRIRTIPDYTFQTCVADAVYFAYFPDGPDKQAALQFLINTTNPVLDHARRRAAKEHQGPSLWWLEVLRRVRETEKLDGDEATLFYNLQQSRPGPRVTSVAPLYQPINFARDLVRADLRTLLSRDPLAKMREEQLVLLRIKADRDPLSPKSVTAYVNAARSAYFGPQNREVSVDLRRRIKRVLQALPNNPALWDKLAMLTLGETPTLEQIDEAGRAADNAFFYSGLLPEYLSGAIYVRLSQVMALTGQPHLKPSDEQDADVLARQDQIINCPLLRDMRLMMAICPEQANFGRKCLRAGMINFPLGPLMEHLEKAGTRSGCIKGTAQIGDLLPQYPVPFDLAAG